MAETMNVFDLTRLVFSRIAKVEPDYATKILGYLLCQVRGEQDLSWLAIGPDKLIQDLVSTARIDLQLPLKQSSPPISPVANPRRAANSLQYRHVLSRCQQLYPTQLSENAVPLGYSEQQIHLQSQFLAFDDQVEKVALGGMEFPIECLYHKDLERHINGRVLNRRSSNLSEYPTKTCHYFSRGFCKHGNSCRYLHGQANPDGFSPMLGHFLNDGGHEDQFLTGSLDELEREVVEIWESRRGNPLSIASLPMIYYERYGRLLQAEGYLTESQRQGKAGHSLTRLLSRLGSIRLIDRPHGQHAVILAEDALKYLEGRNDGTLINSKSRQIYLTFPAESTFMEDDVSEYFRTYGRVEDVRIPCQHKRMFGFVTFFDPETVQTILAKGNPHYVCGARVLVKPYKEKSKLVDRKYQERMESQLHHMQAYIDTDSEQLHSITRGSEASRLLRYQQQLMEEQVLEFEKRHIAQLQLMRKHYQHEQPYLVNSMNGLKISEDRSNVPSSNCFDYLADFLTGEDEKLGLKETASPDQESDVLNLPDSPFASSIIDSITNLIS